MEPVTIIISFLGSLLALVLKPVHALGLFFAVIFLYPQPLTLKLGDVDFSSGRIIILAVLASALLREGNWRRFKFDVLDLWVVLAFLGETCAYFTNQEFGAIMHARAGVLFDTVFAYLAVRLAVTSREKLLALASWFVLAAIPLALASAYEAKTGHNVVGFMERYYSWGMAGDSGDPNPLYMRHGLYRAGSTLGNYISLGMFFAVMAPLCLILWTSRSWRKPLLLIAFGLMMAGLVASMSSGPMFSIVVSLAMLAFFPLRRFWPVLAILLLADMIFMEVFSNRHFYHVLTLFAFDPETAYYRIGLIEECFGGGMSGHWVFGYGFVGVGPGTDNSHFFWEHQDLTNIYIRILASAGLCALAPYLVVNYLYYKRLAQAAKRAVALSDKWLIWCVAAGLVGWNLGMMTVSAMGQIETLLYMLIALCVNLPAIVKPKEKAPRETEAAHRSQHLELDCTIASPIQPRQTEYVEMENLREECCPHA